MLPYNRRMSASVLTDALQWLSNIAALGKALLLLFCHSGLSFGLSGSGKLQTRVKFSRTIPVHFVHPLIFSASIAEHGECN